MPTVPVLEAPTVQAEGLPGRATPRFDTNVPAGAFGADLASTFGKVSDEMSQVQQDLKRQNDQARVVDANTQLEAAKNAILFGKQGPNNADGTPGAMTGGAYSLKGADAMNMPAKYLPIYDQISQQINSTLTPDQQRLFQTHIANGKNELNYALNRYEYDESNRTADHIYSAAGDQTVQNAALNWRDPQQLTKARADLFGLVTMQGDREGWNADQRAQQLLGLRAQMHQAVINQMIADGSPQIAQQYLSSIPRGEVLPTLQEKLSQQVKVGQADAISEAILDTYHNNGQSAGGKAFARLDQLGLPDDIADQVRSDVQKGLGLWRDQQRQKFGDQLEQLEEHIASGKADTADRNAVWTMYNAGALGPSEAGSTIGRIEKAQQQDLSTQAWRNSIAQAYQNGQALDPKDKDIKDGVADLFTSLTTSKDPQTGKTTQSMAPGSTNWINLGADIAAKTGVTPSPVIDWARTQLVSGDPDTAAQAAQAIERQRDANPRGLTYALDANTKAMAKLVNDAVTAGADPKTAVENARNLTQIPDGERKRLDDAYKKGSFAANASSSLTSQLSGLPGYDAGWFSSNPAVPMPMVAQYQGLQHEYYLLTGGNADQANKLAFADLKNTWGITQVNGKRELMQYAPEAVNPGLTTQAVRSDMEAAAAGHTADPTKVRLVATPETQATGGQRFALGVPDKFGAYSVITDDKGRVLPYQLPNVSAAIKQEFQKQSAIGLETLKEKQALLRDAEAAQWQSIQGAMDQQRRYSNPAIK